MDKYRLGSIGGGLGVRRIAAIGGCRNALLGSLGCASLKMLVLGEEMELEGVQDRYEKLRTSSIC
jgi:hypothetical protein